MADQCVICHDTRRKGMIIINVHCGTQHIHIKCFQQYIEITGKKCIICNSDISNKLENIQSYSCAKHRLFGFLNSCCLLITFFLSIYMFNNIFRKFYHTKEYKFAIAMYIINMVIIFSMAIFTILVNCCCDPELGSPDSVLANPSDRDIEYSADCCCDNYKLDQRDLEYYLQCACKFWNFGKNLKNALLYYNATIYWIPSTIIIIANTYLCANYNNTSSTTPLLIYGYIMTIHLLYNISFWILVPFFMLFLSFLKMIYKIILTSCCIQKTNTLPLQQHYQYPA